MSDPYSALQPVIVSALTGAGFRVFDRVPSAPEFPYLRVNLTDISEDDDACGKHWFCSLQVDIWSRAPGRQEASQMAGPVRDALDGISAVPGFKLNYGQWRITRMMDDPDGLTTHGVVTFDFHLSAV